MQDEFDKSVMKMVNDNNTNYTVAVYIMEKNPNVFNLEEARGVANYLMKELGFSSKAILDGAAQADIFRQVILKNIRNSSVLKESEEKVKILLKTIKKKVNSSDIEKIIVKVIAVAAACVIVHAAKPLVTENWLDWENVNDVSSNIGTIVADMDNSDLQNKNLVVQNTYQVGFDEDGRPLVAYNSEGIAQDILKVCSKDETLLDICLYDVYFNMNYNRLANMDEVIRNIKNYIGNDGNFNSISSSLQNVDVFLDYLLKIGVVQSNDADYFEVVNAVEAYKRNGSFESLSEKEQKVIQDFIKKYQSSKKEIYETSAAKINDLVSQAETLGGR